MDKRTKEIIDFTQKKFGLTNYYLKEYTFYRKINLFNETFYTLGMEWFPNAAQVDEDLNPDGTACIEINVQNQQIEEVIFVKGKSYAEDGIRFQNQEELINWIEKETRFVFGEQFQLEKKEDGKYTFKAYIDNIKVSPVGFMEVQFDNNGNLTLFTMDGHFPSKEQVKEEKFVLSIEKITPFLNEQIKLIEIPIYEENKILPIYAVEEIYITNDSSNTLPFHVFSDTYNLVKVDETIYWDEPNNIPFERKPIEWNEEISADQAFSCEPSLDTYPITKEDLEKCKKAITNLLQREYPNDSGNWVFDSLHREKGYLIATLKAQKQSEFVFKRKIQVFINPESFQVENYIDNKELLQTFNDFQKEDAIRITKEQAFEKLKQFVELTPTYVYDVTQNQYVLCGKLDCQYAVNATNGEVVLLDEL